jgi:hypothetical protein
MLGLLMPEPLNMNVINDPCVTLTPILAVVSFKLIYGPAVSITSINPNR